ncbi:MAG: acyltransferase family protein [Maricaulis sp.]|uniref:acyltransferase family protein n=1 Tax=Maricaulis sp. TaxID=1486257 RepID=UPI00263515B5|nr:acyltransferase family protein [Maricaulis sp.]MDM7984938.1 acyltransferase family protein [Maricaulis sp.]
MSVVKNGNPNYRPDIDGLRALAVMSVVLFHVNESWLPGGFIGVDIFFVISGFLITGNIANEVSAGTFSLGEFYRRRIRRILPALTTVLLASLLVGQILFLPEDFKDLAYSALLSQLSLANFYFLFSIDTGYFADDSTLLPLLHLWTLGVEEQFYLIWPLALMILGTRAGGRIFLGLLFAVAMASFILAEFIAPSSPMFAYYMLPTRAGQLLAGAILFYALTRVKASLTLPAVVREIISIAALIVIGASLFMLDEHSTFPGLLAIPVTLGAAGLIFVGGTGGATLTRILSWGPIVWIGLISYSLYLWHWPVLAFARYVLGDLTLAQQLAAMALMFVLSAMSFYWVERPFRRTNRPLLTVTTKYFLAPTAIIGLVLAASIATQGYGVWMLNPNYVQQAREQSEQLRRMNDTRYTCQRPLVTETILRDERCVINANSESRVLLWGDSNAGHFVGTIAEIATSQGFGFRNIAHAGCPPVLAEAHQHAGQRYRDNCRISANNVAQISMQYERIIIAANWEQYINRTKQDFIMALSATIARFERAGIDVLVLARIPRLEMINSRCPQLVTRFGSFACTASTPAQFEITQHLDLLIEAIALTNGADFISFNRILCANNVCNGEIDGEFSYYDIDHLSIGGSHLLGRIAAEDPVISQAVSSFLNDTGATPSIAHSSPPESGALDLPRRELLSSDFVGGGRAYGIGAEIHFADISTTSWGSTRTRPQLSPPPELQSAQSPSVTALHMEISPESTGQALIRLSVPSQDIRVEIVANLDGPTFRRGEGYSSLSSRWNSDRRVLSLTLHNPVPLDDIQLEILPAFETECCGRSPNNLGVTIVRRAFFDLSE